MSLPDYTEDKHIRNERLIRLLDDELTGEEVVFVEGHLAGCALCRERFSELRQTSHGFDSFIASLHPTHSALERQQLAQKLDSIESRPQKIHPHWNLRRVGWGMTVAAALALGVLLLPYWKGVGRLTSAGNGTVQTSSAFEIDGETFIALPYSNPDLPLSAPRIVQMQVPVSSLADAGIYLEPVGNQVSAPDRAVLADVLLGLDGQPLGVHVLPSY